MKITNNDIQKTTGHLFHFSTFYGMSNQNKNELIKEYYQINAKMLNYALFGVSAIGIPLLFNYLNSIECCSNYTKALVSTALLSLMGSLLVLLWSFLKV